MKTMGRSSHCFGIEDELFDKRVPLNGQITKREIRALSISYLHIGTDTVLWDIGSATGSVAIEASRIATQGKIIAIEKNPNRIIFPSKILRIPLRAFRSSITTVPHHLSARRLA